MRFTLLMNTSMKTYSLRTILNVVTICILCIFNGSTTVVLARNTNDQNVQENCPYERSGPDCSIPFQQCSDGKRRCFNQSKCARNSKIDPTTGQHGYHCDCSYAEGISEYAGIECEHSATAICDDSHFCTNGGTCGSYGFKGHHYIGCHCPEDFAGKHCQYLKQSLEGNLEGETAIAEVAEDFYGVKVYHVKTSSIELAVGILFGILLLFSVLYFVYFVKERTNKSQLSTLENEKGELT